MRIARGSANMKSIRKGANELKEVRQGTDLVWQRASTGEFEMDVTYKAGVTAPIIKESSFDFEIVRADDSVDTYSAGTSIPITVLDGEKVTIKSSTTLPESVFKLSSTTVGTKEQETVHLEGLGEVTDMSLMFVDADMTTFTVANANVTKDVSSLYGSWAGCESLTSFPLINISSVTDVDSTWDGCSSLTSFPLIDTSLVTDMRNAWAGCSSLTSFPLIDTSSVTSMEATWSNCINIHQFPLFNTSKVTNMNFAWASSGTVGIFPDIDTSSVITMAYTWSNNRSIDRVRATLDTSSVTNMGSTWRDCISLPSFPALNTSSVTNLSNTWEGCILLHEFPLLDTSNALIMKETWNGCTSLGCIGGIDTTSATNKTNMLTNTILVHPTPAEITDLTDADGAVYTYAGCDNSELLEMDVTFKAGDTSSVISYTNFDFDVVRADASVDSYAAGTDVPIVFNDGETIKIKKFRGGNLLRLSDVDSTNQETVHLIHLGWATSMESMFRSSEMTAFTVDNADVTGRVTNMISTWTGCTSLTSFPAIDTSSATTMSSTWRDCNSLICMEGFDTTSSTNKADMFTNTPALLHPTAAEITDLTDADGAIYSYASC